MSFGSPIFFYLLSMGLFSPVNIAHPDPHGKTLSDAERKVKVRRIESDLSILSSDRLKLVRRKTDRDLELRKLKEQRRRLDVEIETAEAQAKKDDVELRTVEENIRLAKKRLSTL